MYNDAATSILIILLNTLHISALKVHWHINVRMYFNKRKTPNFASNLCSLQIIIMKKYKQAFFFFLEWQVIFDMLMLNQFLNFNLCLSNINRIKNICSLKYNEWTHTKSSHTLISNHIFKYKNFEWNLIGNIYDL